MKITTEEYIRRAKAVHGDKYDYSNTQYTKMSSKVAVICPIHGEFLQNAQSHLTGCGCPECGREQQKQTMLSKYGVDNPMKSAEICSKARQTCLDRYGSEWAMSNETVKDKVTQTNNNRYGVNRPLQNKQVRDKAVDTNLSRYGKKFIGQVDRFRQKARATCLNKYGTEEPLASESVREKIKITNRERYQGNAPMSSADVRQKSEDTVMKKYGVKHIMQSADVIRKIKLTKAKNFTFSGSSSEDVLYQKLCEFYGKDDIKRNYISDRYPYACDFYIISRDMYIELNALWTHGHRWFDASRDIDILQAWQAKKTEYYDNAVYVWSVADVNKREYARRSKLNYVVFWDTELRDADLWFKCNCPDACDYEKEYSWLPNRNISDIDRCTLTGTPRNLSLAAKQYQFGVFYRKEIELWNSNNLFRNLLLQIWLYCNRYEYLHKLPHELTNAELLRGFTISGIHKGYTVFNTALLDIIVKKYNIKSVYDPCAGWGERLLYCYCNNISYHGVDINADLKAGYDKMLSDFDITNQAVEFADASEYEPCFETDAVITCPPYRNTEIYSDKGAENFNQNDFLNWWDKAVGNSLKTNCRYFCFQINQKWKDALIAVAAKHNLAFEEELRFENKGSHFTRNKSEYESMIVMKNY